MAEDIVTLFNELPLSAIVISGLAYACWNIYKDTQRGMNIIMETNNQLAQNNAELVKTNSEIATVNTQLSMLVNDIQDKVNIMFNNMHKLMTIAT